MGNLTMRPTWDHWRVLQIYLPSFRGTGAGVWILAPPPFPGCAALGNLYELSVLLRELICKMKIMIALSEMWALINNQWLSLWRPKNCPAQIPEQRGLTFIWSPVPLSQRVPLRPREGKGPWSKSVNPADPGGQPGLVIHNDRCYSLTCGGAVRIQWAHGWTALQMVPSSETAVCICLLWSVIIIMPDIYL